MNIKTFNMLLFGPPGCGKGTQSSGLISKYDFAHMAPGDILKAAAKKNTEIAEKLATGILFPDEEINSITLDATTEQLDLNKTRFLYDGYPRTTGQAKALDAFLHVKGNKIDLVIFMDVPDKILVARLLKRGETSGRADDQNPIVIQKRLNEYREKTQPVLEHYDKQGVVCTMNGDQPIDMIGGLIEDVVKRTMLIKGMYRQKLLT